MEWKPHFLIFRETKKAIKMFLPLKMGIVLANCNCQARALASKPSFILADEPTANLDSKSSENLLSIMQKLNKNEKTTFIFSTHDQRVIDKANRIVTIEDGKIISDTSQ